MMVARAVAPDTAKVPRRRVSSRVCAVRVASMRTGEGKDRSDEYGHLPQTARHLEALVRADLRSLLPPVAPPGTGALQDGVLILKGRVSSYYLKQIAQRIVLDRLEGRTTVVNNLEVES